MTVVIDIALIRIMLVQELLKDERTVSTELYIIPFGFAVDIYR